MTIEFDPINKYIKILTGSTSPMDVLTIYSAAMDWADSLAGMPYDCPMGAVGKAPMGGGVYTDSVFILQNGWKIKLYNGNYHFIFKGTIITDDGTSRTVNPDSGNVTIEFQVTSQGIVSIQGSGVTQQDKDDISNLVWTNPTGSFLNKVEKNRWKITGSQLLIYDDGGTSVIRTFNLYDESGNPSQTNVMERVPV